MELHKNKQQQLPCYAALLQFGLDLILDKFIACIINKCPLIRAFGADFDWNTVDAALKANIRRCTALKEAEDVKFVRC